MVEKLFAIDLRTLGLFRILLATCALADLALRTPLVGVLTGAQGVIPAAPAANLDLYFWAPSGFWELPVISIAVIAFTALLLGWKTKIVGPLAWFVLLGLQSRNPNALDGGDRVLLQLHLWGLLVPWGARFSLDSAHHETPNVAEAGKNEKFLSFSTVGLMLQVVLVYGLSAVYKLKTVDWREGTAATYALGETLWARPLGTWIANHHSVAQVVTYGTLVVEIVAPLLLLCPFRTLKQRMTGAVLLVGLQIGFGTALRMNLFPWIMTLALVPYLPSEIWERMKRLRGNRNHAPQTTVRGSLLNQVLGVTLLSSVLISGVTHLTSRLSLHPVMAMVEHKLGFGQRWSMYAPPFHQEFGLEVVADFADGSRAVFSKGRGSVDVPALDRLWKDYRGGMYLEAMARSKNPEALTRLAHWLVETWESGDKGRSAVTQVHFTRLTWTRESPQDVEKTHLLSWQK